MKKNNKVALSAIALSVLAVTSASSHGAVKAQLNKVNKAVVSASTAPSFAEWQAEQRVQRNDYTDRLIITFKK